MSPRLAQRIQRIRPSPTMSITALAGKLREDGKDIIVLSAGEPDFPTPEHVQEAAYRSLYAGHRGDLPAGDILEKNHGERCALGGDWIGSILGRLLFLLAVAAVY